MKRHLFLLAMLVLPVFSGGCTVRMWNNATRSHDDGPVCRWVTDRDGVERPVVLYGSSYIALPLDCDGRIYGPVVYNGDGRTAAAIARDLTDEQRAALREYRFATANHVDYSQIKWFPYDDAWNGPLHLDIPEANCTAMAINTDGRPLPVIGRDAKCPDGRLPEDARIVLLPDRQPRDPRQRQGDILLATTFTPLLVAGDIVLSPLYLMVLVAQPRGTEGILPAATVQQPMPLNRKYATTAANTLPVPK
jgi:hypothetical protein